jgi:hypothetical protein
MTIRKPKMTLLTRLLKLFGYERKMVLPDNYQELRDMLSPYIYVRAKWQSLWDVIRRR